MKRVTLAGLGFYLSRSTLFTARARLGVLVCYFVLFAHSAFSDTVIHVCDQDSLVAAIAAGGNIVFDCDGTIVLTNTLVINQAVSLDGGGHNVSISGNDSVRIFQVNVGGSLTLDHLILERGRAVGTNGTPETGIHPLETLATPGGPGQGGALLIGGNSSASIKNCIFRNNQVVGGIGGSATSAAAEGGPGQGGAIYNDGKLSMTNTLFYTNLTFGGKGGDGFLTLPQKGTGGRAEGGALFGSAECLNCQWIGNEAVGGPGGQGSLRGGDSGSGAGGAIYSGNFVRLGANTFLRNHARGLPVVPPAANTAAGSSSGGAICFTGPNGIVVSNSLFLENQAPGGDAFKGLAGTASGGALSLAGSGTVADCKFDRNTVLGGLGSDGALGQGGAIYNSATVSVFRTSFTANVARGGVGNRGSTRAGLSAPGFGGAISSVGGLMLTESTLNRNAAEGGIGGWASSAFGNPFAPGADAFGGGIFNSGIVQATNDTLVSNSANGGDYPLQYGTVDTAHGGNAFGGGVFNAAGSAIFVHCTIAEDSATPGIGVTNGVGFGGALCATNGSITLYNSIVASGAPTNCVGAITDGGGNISSDSSCPFSTSGSLVNTDPLLGPLDNYGGPTQTMPLLSGSPAIDAALAAFCVSTDQRGRTRPFGAQCDIGAFESSPPYTIRGKFRGFFIPGEVTVGDGTEVASVANDGQYALNLAPSGTFSVTPAGTNLLFVPASRSVTVGPDALGIDFQSYRMNGLLIEMVTNNLFRGTYAGTHGQTIQIECSTNLVDWPPFQTNVVGSDGLTDFYQTNQTGSKIKAFRTLILQ